MQHKRAFACGWPLRRFMQACRDYRRRQRDYRHLRDMPDWLLDDIGVSRDRLGPATRRPFV